MDPMGFLVFAGVYAVAVLSPGPALAAIVARVLGQGFRPTLPFIAGIVTGDVIWFSLVALGLSVVAQTFHGVFTVLKYAGAAYLLYLAWKLWTAPAQALEVTQAPRRGEGVRAYLGGLALTMGNPKAMVFFVAILPNVVALERMTPLVFVEVGAVLVLVITTCMVSCALMAERARRFVSSPRAMRFVNRGTGAVMAGAAVAVATR